MSGFPQKCPSRRNDWKGEILFTRPEYEKISTSWRQWIVAFVLFVLTSLSASLAGLFFIFGTLSLNSVRLVLEKPEIIFYGLLYSAPLLAILLAHEMGHYIACWYYGIRCTPPYFIPLPVSITGTLGAFIKIQSPFVSKRALFDVGIAGPLAGFIVTCPVLILGIAGSRIEPVEYALTSEIFFGEPLLFRFLAAIILDYDPSANTLLAGPVAMAAWFGLLVTSLNLLP
ncbi:MAG: site-2 protease family protein, partial [Acidobacteriota bacterium]